MRRSAKQCALLAGFVGLGVALGGCSHSQFNPAQCIIAQGPESITACPCTFPDPDPPYWGDAVALGPFCFQCADDPCVPAQNEVRDYIVSGLKATLYCDCGGVDPTEYVVCYNWDWSPSSCCDEEPQYGEGIPSECQYTYTGP